MWLPCIYSCNRKRYRNSNCYWIYIAWLLTTSQLFIESNGFFFPLFGNFLNKFRENLNHGGNTHSNGGVSVFSGSNALGRNATLIRVPMLRSIPDRRVDVVTTVSNLAAESRPHIVIQSNVNSTAAAEALLSSKLVVPTSTSVTHSISSNQLKLLQTGRQAPSTLTIPFTPNLFGMMSYVQALKDIKRNYKISEKERKIEFLNKEAGDGDLMTRVLRTLIQKVVNKHQKMTEILKLKILKRQEKLQKFLQLPMVAQVIASDQASGKIPAQPVALGKDGGAISTTTADPGKRAPAIVDSFLI